jgi:hypothetical protein
MHEALNTCGLLVLVLQLLQVKGLDTARPLQHVPIELWFVRPIALWFVRAPSASEFVLLYQ